MSDYRIEKLAADTIRVISAEAVQKAKSGHPGMPMGCADFAFALFFKYLRHNPADSSWLGRDRFVLSAGHGSMLLYSLLHLFGYKLPMDELKKFRQLGSLTPGHPEHGHTDGVEVTTGPLGSGFASGVGMALALKSFAARTGLDKTGLMDNKVYMISGDGCMMEGATSEAASFAGHQKLDNIICFYDDNQITIEGSTALAFSEDVGKRFEAYNWRVLKCCDANDAAQIDAVLKEAQASDGRPTLIVGTTKIGFGAPNKQGKASAHGEPLGDDEVAALKKALGLPEDSFHVPSKVREAIAARAKELSAMEGKWSARLADFKASNPEAAAKIDAILNADVPSDIRGKLLAAAPVEKPDATRSSGGAVLQKVSELVPALIGGAADLAPSTKTNIKNSGSFCPKDRAGLNLHFGVRELAMGFIGNGMALSGTSIPYVSTFFVFSDYMKPAIRLAAIQKLHIIYVFTHDSFFVGEDGPTHEPVEQAAMLRSIPGMTVLRPADANETAHAWAYAVKAHAPVAILLTRQNLDPLTPELAAKINIEKGAYVLSEDDDFEMILIATGSEVNTALGAAKILRAKNRKVRVVSMPSCELFIAQEKAYRDSVLPPSCKARVSIEAGITFGWERFVGDNGMSIGLNEFGASAPYSKLAELYEFTPEKVAEKIEKKF